MSLKLGKNFSLPLESASEANAILATRGAGKSYTSAALIEELYRAGIQLVVLDPTGVYWGLRSSADGERDGLAITILGGQHGDVPLEEKAGALIADVLVDTGQSLLLDLSDFPSKAAQTRFVSDFAERLYRRKSQNRTTLHLILDEADEFIPQRVGPKEAVMVGAFETIVKRGRSRGLGVTMITQRSQAINKSVLDLVETLIVMRMLSPRSVKVVKDWINDHELRDELDLLDALPSLPTGEGFVWSPLRGVLERVAFRKIDTFDGFQTPKPGETRAEPKMMAEIDVEALGQKIKETADELVQNDPRHLKRRIVELEREVAVKKIAVTPAEPTVVEKIVEVPALSDNERYLLAKFQELGEVSIEQWRSDAAKLEQLIHRMETLASTPAPRPARAPTVPDRTPTAVDRKPLATPADSNGSLGGGERKILMALASHYPMKVTTAQLGTLSGYAHRGGTFKKYFGILKKSGYLDEHSGEISVTEEGLNYLGEDIPSPKTPEEMLEMWRGALEGGPRKLLDELVTIYPQWTTPEVLGHATGYESRGGTFKKYVGILKRNQLIDTDAQLIRASETFFLGV